MRHTKTHGTLVTFLGMFMWDHEKMKEHENCVNNVQMKQTDELQWMTLWK